MHIGIDIRSLASPIRTGVGEYTFELLNALFAIDTVNQYYLFANAKPALTALLPAWQQANIHYVVTHYPNKLFNAATRLFHFPKIDELIIKREKISRLDYFFSPNLNFTALSKNTKHILTIHDLSFEFFPHFFSKKQRLWHYAIDPKKCCCQAHSILTPSENTKRDLIARYHIDPATITVIPHGLIPLPYPLQEIPAEATLRATYTLPKKYILFLGSIEPRKNIIGLIEGFEQAAPHLPSDLSLVIAGSAGWENKPIFRRLATSPFKNRIVYIGYVEAADKPALYSLAEVFVYPSFYEGFGFPVIEAMGSGTPVITSNRSSLPEIAEGAAYYTNPNKPSSIAEALIRLTRNTELKNRLRTDGLEQAKKYTWEKAARRFLHLLQETG